MATDYTAQDEAWGKQYDEQQAADKQQTEAAKQPQSFLQKFTGAVGRVTSSMIDGAVATAEDPELGAPMRAARDVAAGAVTGAANIADAGVSAAKTALPMVAPVTPEQVAAASPIWDHAKQHIMDFRDAIAVHDPTLSDSLLQGVAQLAIPFTGYSRGLSMLHGVANTVAAGAMTDATALAPHDMRTADLIALGQHAEGKLGDALRAAGPYGLNAYVNYLADRTNETEAQGRFKNVLDGLGINAVAIPLIHAAGVTLKQGQGALRYLAENGVRNTISDMATMPPVGPAAQKGMVAFHGTHADFDAFDNSAIGSGQGAQSYGHGMYFAENPSVAGNYAQRFTNQNITRKDLTEYYKPGETRDLSNGTKDKITAYDKDTGMVTVMRKEPNITQPFEVSYRDTSADWLRVRQALGQPLYKNGKIYTADIGDEHVGKMLDWDAPMTRQPPEVVAAAHQAGIPLSAGTTGEDIYNILKGRMGTQYGSGAKEASDFLSKAGIPGIRYFDQGSRGAKAGSRNLVLFDAKHAKIVSKEEK